MQDVERALLLVAFAEKVNSCFCLSIIQFLVPAFAVRIVQIVSAFGGLGPSGDAFIWPGHALSTGLYLEYLDSLRHDLSGSCVAPDSPISPFLRWLCNVGHGTFSCNHLSDFRHLQLKVHSINFGEIFNQSHNTNELCEDAIAILDHACRLWLMPRALQGGCVDIIPRPLLEQPTLIENSEDRVLVQSKP